MANGKSFSAFSTPHALQVLQFENRDIFDQLGLGTPFGHGIDQMLPGCFLKRLVRQRVGCALNLHGR